MSGIDFDEVYAIKHPDGFWKVGKSGDSRHRLSGIQTGSPYELTLEYALLYIEFDSFVYENEDIESVVQDVLPTSPARGEWFDVSRKDITTAFEIVVDEYDQAHSWAQYETVEALEFRERREQAHEFWMEVKDK